jgi:hypothetical protein
VLRRNGDVGNVDIEDIFVDISEESPAIVSVWTVSTGLEGFSEIVEDPRGVVIWIHKERSPGNWEGV